MPTRVIVGLVLILVGAVIAISEMLNDRDRSDSRLPRIADRSIIDLQPGQVDRIRKLIREDERIRGAIDGNRQNDLRLNVDPWGTAGVNGERLLGGHATLYLDRTISIPPSNWTDALQLTSNIGQRPKDLAPYIQRVIRLKGRGITRFAIYVDLRVDRVVGVLPEGPKATLRVLKVYGPRPGKYYREPKGY